MPSAPATEQAAAARYCNATRSAGTTAVTEEEEEGRSCGFMESREEEGSGGDAESCLCNISTSLTLFKASNQTVTY
ncbi:hypothetical protein NL676_018906 [Syzygium grande]|nr:hypothetical protein NL676_018906 [Syzygium grande]